MQRRLLVLVFVVDVAAGVEQSTGDGQVAVPTGHVQRRVVVFVTGVHQTGSLMVSQQNLRAEAHRRCLVGIMVAEQTWMQIALLC